MTAANVGKQIGIYLDNKLLTNPVVKEAIPSGNAVISGGYKTLQDAQNDALLLNAGALPVQVTPIEKSTVGPTLGQDSLNRSLKAGVIGLALVFLFMLFYYRVPGIVADLSLIVYALIMAGVYLLVHATLTLPGIAAFIISVGMAVDANILIYERLKEELRAGKTLRSSFDAGFRHALRTILDCNVNTLIGACVLYYFGSSDIRGFAVTLFIGVFTSLFTAVTFTRLILHLLVSSRLVLNPKWYGLRTKITAALVKAGGLRGRRETVNLIKLRKYWYILSLLVIVPGLISLGTRHMNFGIDFTGGSLLEIQFSHPVTVGESRRCWSGKICPAIARSRFQAATRC